MRPLSGMNREIEASSTSDYRPIPGEDSGSVSPIQHFQHFVEIEINEYKMKALIDYTARRSSISKNAAEHCGLLREQGNHTSQNVDVDVDVAVKIGTNVYILYVPAVDRMSPAFLLGLDTLRKHKWCLDFGNNSLLSGEEDRVPLLQEPNLLKSRGLAQELPNFEPKMSNLWVDLYDQQREEWHLPSAFCNEKALERQMQMIQGEISEADQTLRHLEAGLHVLVPTSLYIQTVIFGLPSGMWSWVAVLIAWLIVAVSFIVIILNKAIEWREKTVKIQILRGHMWCRKYALGLTVSSCPIYEIGIPHRNGIAGAIYVCFACIMLVAPALLFLFLQLYR